MYNVTIPSPFGTLSGVIGEGQILHLALEGWGPRLPRQDEPTGEDLRTADMLHAQLDEYFAGRRREFDLPLDLRGTEFHRAVWEVLRRIPFGEVRTYGEVAWIAGYPRAARAVGTACSRNPVMLIVPCHRVVAANGILGGYWYGLDMKRMLLRLEGVRGYETETENVSDGTTV